MCNTCTTYKYYIGIIYIYIYNIVKKRKSTNSFYRSTKYLYNRIENNLLTITNKYLLYYLYVFTVDFSA